MKKKSRISKEEILLVMSQEIKEKFQCSTFKVLDWVEAMENQERNFSDPQDFGK
jgi:hypothetical protein